MPRKWNRQPTNEPEEGEEETHEQIVRWESAAEITEELLAEAKPVAFTALPSDRKQARVHHFRFRVEAEGEFMSAWPTV